MLSVVIESLGLLSQVIPNQLIMQCVVNAPPNQINLIKYYTIKLIIDEFANTFLLVGDKFISEMHLKQTRFE